MDITKSTFANQIDAMKRAINEATFLAIDCELSGLHKKFDINSYDTQTQCFHKTYKNSKDFLILQFGLCTFRFNKDTDSFMYQTYNCYVFPHNLNRMMPNSVFLSQASSINFLIGHQFDFNKLFTEGITYMNLQGEESYKKALQQVRKKRKASFKRKEHTECFIPDDYIPFIDSTL